MENIQDDSVAYNRDFVSRVFTKVENIFYLIEFEAIRQTKEFATEFDCILSIEKI